MKTILVTGAAGFIGSNICKQLLRKRGVIVVGIDNFNSYYSPTLKKRRITELKTHKHFVFIQSSFYKASTLRVIQKKYKPDILIHTAAEVGVRNGELHPLSYIKTNTLGTAILLETVGESVKHIMLFSSSSVYGNAPLPFRESTTVHPLSTYGVSKLDMELYARHFYSKTKIPMTIVRPFSVYGPDGRPDMLPMKLLITSLQDKPIKITGGETRRDWTYVDDMANAVAKISMMPRAFEIVNLGFGRPLSNETVLRVAQQVIKKYNHELTYSFLPQVAIESEATHADVTKLHELYSVHFQTPFHKGFEKTAAFFFSHLNLYEKKS